MRLTVPPGAVIPPSIRMFAALSVTEPPGAVFSVTPVGSVIVWVDGIAGSTSWLWALIFSLPALSSIERLPNPPYVVAAGSVRLGDKMSALGSLGSGAVVGRK